MVAVIVKIDILVILIVIVIVKIVMYIDCMWLWTRMASLISSFSGSAPQSQPADPGCISNEDTLFMLHDRIVGCLDIADADVLLQFLVSKEKDHGTLAITGPGDTWWYLVSYHFLCMGRIHMDLAQ